MRRYECPEFDDVRDELLPAVGGPGGLAGGLELLGAIEDRYGPVPLGPVW